MLICFYQTHTHTHTHKNITKTHFIIFLQLLLQHTVYFILYFTFFYIKIIYFLFTCYYSNIFFFEKPAEETLLNQPKLVTITWWRWGGTSSIHTVRASMCLAYWAKLWARELLVLRVCEKEIQEKIPRLCLIVTWVYKRKIKKYKKKKNWYTWCYNNI